MNNERMIEELRDEAVIARKRGDVMRAWNLSMLATELEMRNVALANAS